MTLTYFQGHRGHKGSIKLFFVSGANLLDYQQWSFKIAYVVGPHVLVVPFEDFIDLWLLTYFFGRGWKKWPEVKNKKFLQKLSVPHKLCLCMSRWSVFIKKWPWPIFEVTRGHERSQKVKNLIPWNHFNFTQVMPLCVLLKRLYKKWPWPIFEVTKGH